MQKLLQRLLQRLIRLYQLTVSPLLFSLGQRCRFEPSCSQYALEALEKHGAYHGGALAAKRLCKCHPWGGSGFDPVPTPQQNTPNPPQTP